jgi:glycosyltransferase involved in cell wall biosynthesis
VSEGVTPPLRVMYLINGLGTGGAERSLADLLPALGERGVWVQVACLYPRLEGVQGEVTSNADVRFLPAHSWPGWIREARRLIRELKPDVIHTTIFEADLVGRLAAAGTRIPVLTSLVNTSYDRTRLRIDPNVSRFRLVGGRILDGLTARHLTTRFHAITEAVKQSAVQHLHISPDAVTVIGRTRDLTRLGKPSHQRRGEVRTRLALRETDEIVLALGRQEYQKGHNYLLEAASQLRSTRPNLRVIVAGREGNASVHLGQAMDRHGLEGIVSFLGHRQDVGDLLSAADVFCFPSVYEGLGGAVIEAMAMGLPVVASDLPALREVVGDTGILVLPESAAALASAISQLLDDRVLAANLAKQAAIRVSELFDLEDVADQMAALYRRVAALRAQ